MSLRTGKKIKQQAFTKFSMPHSVIKQVKTLGHKGGAGAFDFADPQWHAVQINKEVDKHQEGLAEKETILYPYLVAEFPGVTLNRYIPTN